MQFLVKVICRKQNEKEIINIYVFFLFHSELEKIGNSLNPLSSVTPNSIHLSIDPAIDKTPIYNQIIQAYKWSNKVLMELVLSPLFKTLI